MRDHRFVDVRPFEGSDDEYFHGSLVGSSTICRALGAEGPGKADAILGTVTHLAVFQSDRFDSDVRVPPSPEILAQQYTPRVIEAETFTGTGAAERRKRWVDDMTSRGLTPVAKSAFKAALRKDLSAQWEADNAGKIIVTPSVYEEALQMRGGVFSNPDLARQLQRRDLMYERSYQAVDTVTGLQIRIRPDAWRVAICWDLKTAKSPSPSAFEASIARYLYYVQAALYVDVLHALTGRMPHFAWIVAGKLAPHWSTIYQATEMDEQTELPGWLAVGRRAYDAGLKIIAAARRNEQPIAPWWAHGGFRLTKVPPWTMDALALHERYAASVWKADR